MGGIKGRQFVVHGAAAAVVALALAGCSTGPLRENPTLFRPDLAVPQENPLYLAQGSQPEVYDKIFQTCLDVLDDIWGDIAFIDRYGGRIETAPAVAPGIEQPWKPGSPSFRQRLLATCQSIRHRAIVQINTADQGGYWVRVQVLKELEDLPAPMRSTTGAATFRMNATVERQYEVIEQTIYQANWIPIGNDAALEQVILQRLAHTDFKSLPNPKVIYNPPPGAPAPPK